VESRPALSAFDDIHRVFDAFRGGDPRALFEVIAEDAVWRVPGTVQVAREYRGRDEIFGLFRETRRLTDGTYPASSAGRSPTVTAPSPSTAPGVAGSGANLDIDQVLLIALRDGRWHEVLALPTDPQAFAAFWA